jgi:hypothetical protein
VSSVRGWLGVGFGSMVARGGRLERVEPFVPLRPVPRGRLILWAVIGPLAWLVALLVAAIVLHRTRAIELGMAIAFGCLALSMVVLLLVRGGRDRERRRYGTSR